MRIRFSLLVVLFSSASAMFGQSYERVLVPLLLAPNGIPGDRGSLWVTRLEIYNANDVPVTVTPTTRCGVGGCAQTVWPSQSFAFPFGLGPTGIFHYVGGPGADPLRVVYHLRAQDLSRQASTWGTEIPVARRRDFSGTSIELLGVPLDTRFRQTTRIYDYEGKNTKVIVRLFPMDAERAGSLIGERSFDIVPPEPQDPSEPIKPAYLQLGDLLRVFPEASGRERVRIEIVPEQTGTLIWAFCSVTNNETQHVTVIVPR